jgi:hypothetical protein
VVLHLPGGLGNQLFVYFAAINLARKFQLNIEIDLSSINLERTSGLYSIESFFLKFPIANTGRNTQLTKFVNLNLIRLRHRSKLIDLMMTYYKGEIYEATSENFRDLELRLQSVLKRKLRRTINLHGYFQNCNEIMEIDEKSRCLNLKNPSYIFKTLQLEASRLQPIMMHCRLGDYASESNIQKIGVLSPAYFRKCLELLPESLADREIWLFSDDIQYARELYGSIDSRINFIDLNGDPAETLMLFTLSSVIICANSSFSLVSALINPSERLIYYPRPWTKSGMHTQETCPPQWKAVESIWM